jgi:hypothetical protein
MIWGCAGFFGGLSEAFNRLSAFDLVKHRTPTDLAERRQAAKPQSDERKSNSGCPAGAKSFQRDLSRWN